MKNKDNAPIIKSLLDTDLYKFTMWQALLHSHPSNTANYQFVCRNTPQFPLSKLVSQVNEQLDALCELKFKDDELDYLGSRSYLKSDFIEFLRLFHFQRRYIDCHAQGDRLVIEATGPQVHTMGFEIFVLSIVNELYFRAFDTPAARVEGQNRLDQKIALLGQVKAPTNGAYPFEFFDFGTRRRFAGDWHQNVVRQFKERTPQFFKGTSNVLFAKEMNLVPIGTMAHEYLQTFQAVGVQLKEFQAQALDQWAKEFRGDLGIALTDVVGMDAFLKDFDLYFAKLFDGMRHDSGDPFEWAQKAIDHYQKLKINPRTKRLVFSDGLDLPKALSLHAQFSEKAMLGFGIGTNLTNDCGITPLNIVMKLMNCNNQPVAKLSDTPGKTLCQDETFLAYLRQVFAVAEPKAAVQLAPKASR